MVLSSLSLDASHRSEGPSPALPIFAPSAKEADAMLLLMEPAGMADSAKGFVKPSSLMKGFLRWGFLNPSPTEKASTTHTSLLETAMSSLTPATPFVEKGDDSTVNKDSSLAIMDAIE
jgi:hypothetical protein